MVEAHLAMRTAPHVIVSDERAGLLVSGGGMAKALPLLGEEPFFTVNAKVIWLNGKLDCLERLAQAFDPEKMDALLLLQSIARAVGYDGMGDFFMDPFGRLTRRPERQMAPFLYAGIQLCHPRLFRDTPKGAFSTNLVWDRAIEEGRLYGIRHDGEWYHVSTPAHLEEVERHLTFHGWRF
jgi:MurNAc alpha-1-phosphate uridylyltransferase